MKPANVLMLVVGAWMVTVTTGVVTGGRAGIGVAQAANAEAEGRKHARKANHLADINKCKAAIPEYSKAIRLLKDPTLLFNRAECYRRTGEASKAVADYRKFLVELPGAPNRAQVETQIAALDKSAAPRGGPAKSAATAAARAPVGKSAPATPVNEALPAPVAGPAPAPSRPPPTPTSSPQAPTLDPEPAPDLAEHEAPDLDAPRRVPRVRASAAREPTPALIDSATKHDQAAEAGGSSSHWWAWVLGAVVVGGGVTGTYFLLKQGKTDIPMSTLGNYKF